MSDGNTWETSNFGGSLWSTDLMEKAQDKKFLIYILLIILSGFGNMFSIIIPNISFFGHRIVGSKQYLQTFYKDEMQKYIEDIGFFDQAVKSGLLPSSEKIREFIENQHEFLSDGKFDIQKYKTFLKDKSLKEYEVFEFYKRKLSVSTFKEAIHFNEKAEEYNVIPKILNYSTLVTNNAVTAVNKIDPKEFKEFLFKKMRQNSLEVVDAEKFTVQYIEVQYEKPITHEKESSLYEILKNSKNIKQDCEGAYGKNIIVSTFLMPMGAKGKYHNLNFVFEKKYIKRKGNKTLYAVVKKIQPMSLKEQSKIDFDFLQKLYLAQMRYKMKFLEMIKNPFDAKEIYLIKKTDLNSLKDIEILKKKNLLFMKEGEQQIIKNSDGELYIVLLNKITENPEAKNESRDCNIILSNTLSHNFFIESIMHYWMNKTHESL